MAAAVANKDQKCQAKILRKAKGCKLRCQEQSEAAEIASQGAILNKYGGATAFSEWSWGQFRSAAHQ